MLVHPAGVCAPFLFTVFVWLITTLAGFLIYNCCFYYSHRNLFRSIRIYVRNVPQIMFIKLEPDWSRTGASQDETYRQSGKFPALSIIYSNCWSNGLLFRQIKHGGPQTWKRRARRRWSTPKGRWRGRLLVYKLYVWVLRVSRKLCLLGKKVLKILHTLLQKRLWMVLGWMMKLKAWKIMAHNNHRQYNLLFIYLFTYFFIKTN